jgi:hypothetical protein
MKCRLIGVDGAPMFHPTDGTDKDLVPIEWEDDRVPHYLFDPLDRWPCYPNRDARCRYQLDIDGTRHEVPLCYSGPIGPDILWLLLRLATGHPA